MSAMDLKYMQQKPRGCGGEKQLGSRVQDTIQVSEKDEAILEAEPVPVSCHIQGIGFYVYILSLTISDSTSYRNAMQKQSKEVLSAIR